MWILLALLARLFWAGTNATDQILSRIHPVHSTMAAFIVQYMCYLPFAIAAYFMARPFPFHSHFLFFCAGAVLGAVLASAPYFEALRREQAYNVTPYLELTPVFLIVYAYLFKGEVLTPVQMAGATIVILGGFLFSWDFAHGRFKTPIFLLLTAASMFFAVYQYCISQAEPLAGIWAVAACCYLGISSVGFVLFLVRKDVRGTIIDTLVRTKGRSVILALSTNVMDLLALGVLLLAFRLAPTLGHVASLSGTQPIFSMALTIPLAKFFPQHFSKIDFDRAIFAKMGLVIVIFFGVCLLTLH